jgi:hypothetical protein
MRPRHVFLHKELDHLGLPALAAHMRAVRLSLSLELQSSPLSRMCMTVSKLPRAKAANSAAQFLLFMSLKRLFSGT